MFLDQIITIGSAYLHEYQKIKERLNFNLDDPIIQNPQITRPETPPTNDEPIHLQGRPKLIASWTPTITDMIYGKILTATHFPNTVPILYAEHWIHRNLDTSNHHNTPHKLNLHITLHKVKAHSNNAFNDIADAQAKVGHFHQTPTSINHRHLPSQMITIEWNNEIPIDKDVRKCIGTISNYKRIEDHLNHPSLIDIKEATAQHIINWSCTSKWFNYNGHETATSTQHIKDTAWKIKRSTLNLPTLDILNRNFPKLIKNHTCLL
ncbi:hypothetical protein RhiirA4_467560 [Rhizophagus irregularis]|uniref:RNase H type-1 domain-containing protein n=1 Tax=Rhizophagus irregularis TaxID=588596 RepID=A0A2I1GW62_9GLOM|nr:hypothetical protein RhiirA4_467560 [Rhizophagus irregularis]